MFGYKFPSMIDFTKRREESARAMQEFWDRWCRCEHVVSGALNAWRLSVFNIFANGFSF